MEQLRLKEKTHSTMPGTQKFCDNYSDITNNKYKLISLLIAALFFVAASFAQNASIKHLSKKHQTYYDSLKNMNYDRMFPIWGSKVYKKGFDIPFPFGIMFNTFYCRQNIDISNINIGVTTPNKVLGPVNLDSIIKFSEVTAKVVNLNFRADLWIFPFLNVYLLGNYLPRAQTKVVLSDPIVLTADPVQSGWAWGPGAMVAFGFGPVWMQTDANFTWATMELLDNKVFTQVYGVRMGHVFPGKKDPEHNVSLWIGGMAIFYNNRTIGSIAIDDLFPEMTQQQVDQIRAKYNSNASLTTEQKQVMDEITNKISTRIGGGIPDGSFINYELDKAPQDRWSGLVGAQYQFSKRWQFRTEWNVIGDGRFSGMLSINYRFLGFKKR
jgi:hypothetical protein